MHSSGRYGVSNSVKKEELAKEYDVDHVLTEAITEVDNIIESCDLGQCLTEQTPNKSLIIKSVINHLIDKL